MYKWINVHIYKCLNPKYTHAQLYNVQMYNVQMYNVQMYNVQMYNVQKYNVQKDNVLNMSAVLGVILTFFWRRPKKKKVRYLVRPLGKTPSDQFQALPFALRSPFSVCFDDIQNGSSFYNIHPRIKCLT